MSPPDETLEGMMAGVPSLQPECHFFLYRTGPVTDGSVTTMQRSFSTAEQVHEHAAENELEGTVFHVKNPSGRATWTMLHTIPEGLALTEAEKRQIGNLTYRPKYKMR